MTLVSQSLLRYNIKNVGNKRGKKGKLDFKTCVLQRIPSRNEKARMAVIKKKKSVGKDVEKLEHSSIVNRDTKWFSCCGKQFGNSSKS